MAVPYLAKRDAGELLRHCREQGEVVLGRHFRDELAKEEITFQDAWVVLCKGLIYQEPERDITTGEWKYRVEGHEPGGRWLVIVFSFKSSERAFLITIFSVESRRRT